MAEMRVAGSFSRPLIIHSIRPLRTPMIAGRALDAERLPRLGEHGRRLPLAPAGERLPEARRAPRGSPVVPARLGQEPPRMDVAGLGDAPAAAPGPSRGARGPVREDGWIAIDGDAGGGDDQNGSSHHFPHPWSRILLDRRF